MPWNQIFAKRVFLDCVDTPIVRGYLIYYFGASRSHNLKRLRFLRLAHFALGECILCTPIQLKYLGERKMVVFFGVVTPNPVNRAPLKSSLFFKRHVIRLNWCHLLWTMATNDVVVVWYMVVQVCWWACWTDLIRNVWPCVESISWRMVVVLFSWIVWGTQQCSPLFWSKRFTCTKWEQLVVHIHKYEWKKL